MSSNEEAISPNAVALASLVGLKIQHLMIEAQALAQALGEPLEVSQIIAGVLAGEWYPGEAPLSREEFAGIYDRVESLVNEVAQLAAVHFDNDVSDQIAGLALDIPDFAPLTISDFPPEQEGK